MMKIKSYLDRWMKHPSFYAVCFWAVVGFVVLVISDFIIMPILAGHLSFTSEVPNVVGKSAKEAETLILDEDLKVVWDSVGRFSSKIPAGAVLVQVPSAGRRVKEGRTVYLIKSSGQRQLVIPDLRGKSQAQATITLHRLGLVQGKLIQGAHVSIPRGVVIRTQPAAGKVVRMGDRVDVVISTGTVEGRQRLPELVGMSLERSAHILDSLGFLLGKVDRKPVADKTPNSVIEQRPASGEFLDPGTTVELSIVD